MAAGGNARPDMLRVDGVPIRALRHSERMGSAHCVAVVVTSAAQQGSVRIKGVSRAKPYHSPAAQPARRGDVGDSTG